MRTLHLPASRVWLLALACATWLMIPEQAHALLVINPGGGFNGGGGGGGAQATPAPPMQRLQGNGLPNPINFYQYSQITGVKPIVGTVRIYNQFGMLANQNGSANQGYGGGGGGFGIGGFGGGGFGGGGGGGNQLPGMGATSGGDDPPQGVLLHVNYANMFFPNQTQLNQTNQGNQGFGGIGGFGNPGFGYGFNPGFGKGGFGNGGNGL